MDSAPPTWSPNSVAALCSVWADASVATSSRIPKRIEVHSTTDKHRSVLVFGHNLDFKKLRPPFPGDKDAPARAVVGDSVEHIGAGAFGAGQKSAQINPAEHSAVGRRDPRDAFGLPDVGPDLSFDKFELVETGDRASLVAYFQLPHFRKLLRIPEA